MEKTSSRELEGANMVQRGDEYDTSPREKEFRLQDWPGVKRSN